MHYATFGSAMYLEEQNFHLGDSPLKSLAAGKIRSYMSDNAGSMSVLNDAPRSLSFNYRQPAMGRAASTGLGGLLESEGSLHG